MPAPASAPQLLFGRLWDRLGLGEVVREPLDGRGFGLDVERAVFASVLHRLFVSGSERLCEKWMADYALEGIEGFGCTISTGRWHGSARIWSRRRRAVWRRAT